MDNSIVDCHALVFAKQNIDGSLLVSAVPYDTNAAWTTHVRFQKLAKNRNVYHFLPALSRKDGKMPVPTGLQMCGRVVDALGEAVDGDATLGYRSTGTIGGR